MTINVMIIILVVAQICTKFFLSLHLPTKNDSDHNMSIYIIIISYSNYINSINIYVIEVH